MRRMAKCDECQIERDERDLRYNPKWDNHICRYCFMNELLFNAGENKAIGALLHGNAVANSAAVKAANMVFDKLMKKKK
jgi:hypothetical protein